MTDFVAGMIGGAMTAAIIIAARLVPARYRAVRRREYLRRHYPALYSQLFPRTSKVDDLRHHTRDT